jgi:hypothetical protein
MMDPLNYASVDLSIDVFDGAGRRLSNRTTP